MLYKNNMENKQKYFKIVNPDGHHGLVYREGYNEDPLPFNPNGDCQPGGIYFSSRDIFSFLRFGTEVYEVEPVGDIYENPGEPKKYKAHALNMQYIGKINDINTIKYLVENGADIHTCDDYALLLSSEYGYLEVVKYLIELGANIHALNEQALHLSAQYGYLKVVKYLLNQGADIHALVDHALRAAANYGHLEVVKYLVENGADIHAMNDEALRLSSANGHLDVVKYLYENGANIHDRDDEALRLSSEYCHLEVVEYLKSLE